MKARKKVKKSSDVTFDYQPVSQSWDGNCENYVRKVSGGKVEVETLRRYGKAYVRTMKMSEFVEMMRKDTV